MLSSFRFSWLRQYFFCHFCEAVPPFPNFLCVICLWHSKSFSVFVGRNIAVVFLRPNFLPCCLSSHSIGPLSRLLPSALWGFRFLACEISNKRLAGSRCGFRGAIGAIVHRFQNIVPVFLPLIYTFGIHVKILFY